MQLRLDGELPQADARALDEHLAQCADCRELAEGFATLDAKLREGLTRIEVPAGLEGRIRASMHARAARPALLPRLAYAFAAAAALALAVHFGSEMIGSPADASPAVVARGGESLHVFSADATVAGPARTGDRLAEDAVAWGINETTIALRFRGGARLELSREAVVKIGSSSMTLIKGGLYADLTEAQDGFQVITPWGAVSGPGSAFALISGGTEEDARLLVSAGQVTIEANNGHRTAHAGDSLVLGPDTARVLML